MYNIYMTPEDIKAANAENKSQERRAQEAHDAQGCQGCEKCMERRYYERSRGPIKQTIRRPL